MRELDSDAKVNAAMALLRFAPPFWTSSRSVRFLRMPFSLMGQVGKLFRVSSPWDACVLCALVRRLMG